MNYNFHNFLTGIPKEFINFIIVTVFSLIIGLSQRKLHHSTEEHKLFGTDRTFTFIGILGYILIIADPVYKTLFMAGGFAVAALLTVNYIFKIKNFNEFGVTSVIIALLTYCIPLLLITQPFWLFLLIIVTVIIFTESKETFSSVTEKFDRHEFVTLAKFIIMAGLILPIVPDYSVIPGLPITPFKIWLAVVVISSISYVSYLLKKFVFKDSGILLSGILGGLYSSTATTVVLSRKLREQGNGRYQYIAAIIMATSMMYFRVLILVLIFNKALFKNTILAFIILIIISLASALVILFRSRKHPVSEEVVLGNDRNPLEFKVALIFTVIFVLFTFLTQFAIKQYGNAGLSALSFIVGVADIDPFLLNIFQVKYAVTIHLISLATFQAIISNNLAKMCYACFFSGKKNWKIIVLLFSIIIVVNVILLFFL
jgi:uncharacterized membrane protein (DUF4010 family)